MVPALPVCMGPLRRMLAFICYIFIKLSERLGKWATHRLVRTHCEYTSAKSMHVFPEKALI